MKESIRLGRIAGVAVGLNWSVLAIFALISVGLATGQFPSQYPGRSTAAYVVAALVAAVVFFLSLLAHEVSHAVVARRNGIEVDGITLWLFGGVARLNGDARTPGADFRIAGVGPLVSVLLGLGFAVVAGVAMAAGVDGLPLAVLGYLAGINLVLAVFNLVPAAPLDGGRLLRAGLWRWRGDRIRAAVTAARAGRAFGGLLVALGFLQVVAGGGYGGLWLVLIGFFLVSAAGAEEQQAQVQHALAGVRVADVMTPEPMVASGDHSVADFLDDYVLRHRFSAYPLVDPAGRPTGLVTLNRLRGVPPERRADTGVAAVSCRSQDVPVARPDEALTDLLSRMSGCTDGRALVLDHAGRVIGIVSPTDVARALHVADLRGGPVRV